MEGIMEPEAYSEEYVEQLAVLDQIFQERYLKDVACEISNATSYTHLYREHADRLRKIDDPLAKDLLQDLMLLQTLPLSELEALNWKMVGGEWVEVDSYTSEPFEIDTEAGRIKEGHMLGNRLAPKIPYPDNSLTTRIVEEYKARGVDEKTISLAVKSNGGSYDTPAEDIWYEEGEIPSPLWQEEHLMLKPDYETLAELRQAAFPLLVSIKALARKEAQRCLSRGMDREQIEITVRHRVAESPQADEMIEWACQSVHNCDVQDLYIILASAVWLDERLDEIPVPIYGDMGNFADTFGEDVLDNIIDAGWNPMSTSQEAIDRYAKLFEDEIVSTFDPEAEKIFLTPSYARGVLHAATSGQSNLNSAGYSEWRYDKSRIGAISFNTTLAIEKENNTDPDEAIKRAWRAFWNAGYIVRVSSKGVVVKSDATGEEHFAPWGLARWKLPRKEIVLDTESKSKLKNILSQKGWGISVLETL
jgi:hypothetical protein